MDAILPYVAPAMIIAGALLAGLNLGPRVTGFGFIAFTLGSLAWLAIGLGKGDAAVVWQNAVLTLLNGFGAWRWLGREAAHEKGAARAQQKSEAREGADLFPASLLTRAAVAFDRGEGKAVDAMLDCRDGRPSYLVVAEGGIAGAGETLRRVPWRTVTLDGDTLAVGGHVEAFAELDKSDWPGR